MPPVLACDCTAPSPATEALWEKIRRSCEAVTHGKVEIIFHAGKVRDWHVTESHKPGPSEQGPS